MVVTVGGSGESLLDYNRCQHVFSRPRKKHQAVMPGPPRKAMHTVVEASDEEEDASLDDGSGNVTVTVD
jgi:hypothetical protein